jgi:hypothetical protein
MGMELQVMTVTKGCTPDKPYAFTVDDDTKDERTVLLVMPLGGAESGLYRSPKAGESVLVGVQTSGSDPSSTTYYLMGYLPSSDNPFTRAAGSGGTLQDATGDVVNASGEVFRYQQTGKKTENVGEERYSEIGFYHKQTSWKPDTDKAADYADIKTTAETKDGKTVVTAGDPPFIDLVNIHSTGDIHESAVNHHRIEARRLELLADSEPTEEEEKKKKEEKEKKERDALKAGNIRVKAGQDITIEAGGSLTLKAGRGSITISDSGVTISHQLMRNLPNAADASVSLNAREGISIAGEAVDISADHSWSIGEKLGSSAGGAAGALSLNAREINVTTPEWLPQLAVQVAYGLSYIQKIAQGALAIDPQSDDYRKNGALITKTIISNLKNLGDLFFTYKKFQSLMGKFRNFNAEASGDRMYAEAVVEEVEALQRARENPTDAELGDKYVEAFNKTQGIKRLREREKPFFDISPALQFLDGSYCPPYQQVATAMELVLTLIKTTFTNVERFMELEGNDLDTFNYASIVVTNATIMGFTSAMLLLNRGLDGAAGLCLGFDGSVVTKAARDQVFYAVTKEKGAATATMVPRWVKAGVGAAWGITKANNLVGSITTAVSDFKKLKADPKAEVL